MSKKILESLNAFIEKFMPLVTFSGIIIGFLLGSHAARFSCLASPFFAVMTFCSTMDMNISDFKKTLSHPLPVFLFLIVFHAIQPLITFCIAHLIFPNDSEIVTGLILLYAIPVAVSASIWTHIFHGSVPLTITLILIDTIIGPAVTPVIVKVLCGTAVQINGINMFLSLVWMILIPSILGIALNHLTKGSVPKKISPVLKPFSKIALLFVIVINAGKISTTIHSFDIIYVYAGFAAFFLSFNGFIIANAVSLLFKFPYEDRVAFVYSASMRNISAALVISIAYFSPRCSIPVVIGILFQQTLAALSGKILLKKDATQES